MMVLDGDKPVRHRYCGCLGLNRSIRQNVLGRLIPAKYIDASVGGILQYSKHTAVSQAPPDELAVPDATIRPLGKLESHFRELMNHAVGTSCLAKSGKLIFDSLIFKFQQNQGTKSPEKVLGTTGTYYRISSYFSDCRRKCYFYCLEDLSAVALTFTADGKALAVLFDGYLLQGLKILFDI